MSKTKKRVIILAGSIFLLYTLLVMQFYRLQILEHVKWSKKAEQQHYFVITEPAVRGTFWTNSGLKKGHPEASQKLAVDIRKYHLHIDVRSLPAEYRTEIANTLKALSTPTMQESLRFYEQFEKNSRNRKLVSWLDEDKKQAIIAWWRPYARERKIASNAVFFVPDYLRSHPLGKLLGQVLHTVQLQRNEKTNAPIPTGGLELSCNKYIAGKNGKKRLMRSPRHSLELQQVIQEPDHGADCYLTINHCLQAIAEEEVEKGVKGSQAKSGWAIIMNPHTGELYAMAQYPYFIPDQYPLYFNNKELMENAKIKMVTDANEPGSTMKPITLAIALAANQEMKKQGKAELFSPTEKIDTSKGNFPGRGKKPITDTRFHHYLNMYLGLQKSSNIYPATLVKRVVQNLGDEWYRDALYTTFGFGKKTHIGLPGEGAGVLPSIGKKNPNGTLEWSLPTPYSLAMGYNLQATSLQMVRAYSILANGGYFVEPYLIRKVVKKRPYSNEEEVLLDNTKPKTYPKVLDDSVVKEVVKAMRFVTKPGGAGALANIWGYTEAGKTGTTMKLVGGSFSNKAHFASFIGFAPVTSAEFVIFVAMDEPKPGFIPGKGINHHGGTCAAPVFREIARRSLEYLGVSPDDPGGYPKNDPRYDPEKADGIKEAENLRKLYDEWNKKI